MIFTDYWRVLVLNFSVMGNSLFFESKSWWKYGIDWLLRSSCFEFYGDGKHNLFLSQKVGGKMALVFLSFPWYSRTWKIWFFVQCQYTNCFQTKHAKLSISAKTGDKLKCSNNTPIIRKIYRSFPSVLYLMVYIKNAFSFYRCNIN